MAYEPMRKYIAETVATFALVFAGTGAIVINDISGGSITHVGISLTFGLIVMVMIYSVGDISGAHMNPAVTVGFCFAGRMDIKEVGPFVTSQVAGAVLASGLLKLLFPSHETLGATLPSGSVWQTFALEVVLTFILMFVILNVSTGAKEKGIMAGVAVGGTVALASLFAGPIGGASMNPARSIGPALISGQLEHLWIYLTATFIGALLAYLVFKAIRGGDSSCEWTP